MESGGDAFHMKPFFSYYGAKYIGARYYGVPRRDLVIEPFAGSACYSTRWGARRVRLYDVSLDICDVWDFLIHSSCRDIAAIPSFIRDGDALARLPRGPRLLVGWWVAKGAERPRKTPSRWYCEQRNSHRARVWGDAVKQRIIDQKWLISTWSIDQLSYESIPDANAHWHIDPPYSGKPGRRYPFSKIDYALLGEWCRTRPGAVDVCENEGASWLPFTPLYDVVTSRGRPSGAVSREVVWRRI